MRKSEGSSSIQKYIGIVPTIGHSFEDMFTEKNTFFSEIQGKNPMYIVREILEKSGIYFLDATKVESPSEISVVLYFGNINTQMLYKFKDSINAYFAFEPPVVDATNDISNLILLKKYFDYIISWNDSLIDGEVFLKFNYCVDFFNNIDSIPTEDKKLLTNISGNKHSKHKEELYSKRLEVINYFEDLPHGDFEFWGNGWSKNDYKNYRGKAASKADVYKNFKFAICFENQKNLNGYITEKILDCFICKIIPIYWGAGNIEKYIPKVCYIDYRDFKNIQDLVVYLKNITREEYFSYIKNIEGLLNSDGIIEFKPEAFADIIIELLSKKKKVQITYAKVFILQLIKMKLRIRNSVQSRGYRGILKKVFRIPTL